MNDKMENISYVTGFIFQNDFCRMISTRKPDIDDQLWMYTGNTHEEIIYKS